MQLEELFDYKNLLMKELCSNEAIVRLLSQQDDPQVPNYDLPYTQIYPFEYVPETEDKGRSFICFEVDIHKVENKTFYIPVIYVWVIVHKGSLRTKDKRLRLDELTVEVNKILNGSRYFGLGAVELDSTEGFHPTVDYLGRVLVYYAADFNQPSGRRKMPANRKIGV